jgi:hypothetical protein
MKILARHQDWQLFRVTCPGPVVIAYTDESKEQTQVQ